MLLLSSFLTFLASAFALEAGASVDIGVSFGPGGHGDGPDHGLPLLKLPYGTWRAQTYDEEADVYRFRNIRFAAPPVGDLRWAKPAPPEPVHGVQDGSYGHNCIAGPIPGAFDDPVFQNLTKNGGEDCLFLDVYVPGHVLKHRKKSVPVVVWIYGGGYVTGAKDQAIDLGIYGGNSLIQRADNDLIVVSINYRLGAFGFLAGEPLQNHGGIFNAGLHDQRAALEWVQSYIHLLGGDPDNVSAWGESAGAGSIAHHLVAEGGRRDPLFNTAVMQSPGFAANANIQAEYDRFEAFAAAVGCPVTGAAALHCLRAVNATALTKANADVFGASATPIPDGKFLRSPALYELANGNVWPGLTSLIASHVLDEGSLFVPPQVPPGYIDGYLTGLLPRNATAQAARIINAYRTTYPNATERELAVTVSRDIIFTCNIRAALEAYAYAGHGHGRGRTRAWALQYAFLDGVTNATHGADVSATFFDAERQGYEAPLFEEFQRYLTNFARTGDPNLPRCGSGEDELEFWPRVSGLEEEVPDDVMEFTNGGFVAGVDEQLTKGICDTWVEVVGDSMGV
ncbi:Alpha/Beta hydrolase protein [Aspergillus lucknowensis]|uniref:Alpha/Beta hydrolase protein n=1 Tax=Aspergillus lucknowensis TaxID=176173 RepID=A0ABR4M046_9EURO